jgi:ATP-binding cassette subfamily B multidrug efflux pump
MSTSTPNSNLNSNSKIKNKDRWYIYFLFQFVLTHKIYFIKGILLLALGPLFVVVSAKLLGILVQEGLLLKSNVWTKSELTQNEFLILIGTSIFLLEACSIFVQWRGRIFLSEGSFQCLLSIRKKLFAHYHQLPLKYFDTNQEGKIVNRMTHDVEGIEEFFNSALGRLVQSMMIFIWAFIATMMTSPKLGFIIVLGLVPGFYFTLSSRQKVRISNRLISKRNSQFLSRLNEFLRGHNVIQLFGLEKWSQKILLTHIKDHYDSQMELNRFYGWNRPTIMFCCALPTLLLLYFGGRMVILGTLSIGTFVTLVRLSERFVSPIVNLTRELPVLQQALTSTERVIEFLNQPQESNVLGPDGLLEVSNLKGHIRFSNVSMGHNPEVKILNKLNFEIKAGEKVALVGRTGSGKTTTLSLLTRLYDYQEGEIFLDGINLKDFQRKELRKLVAPVAQETILFQGTLRENLIAKNQTDVELGQICHQTGLWDVMMERGLNFDSLILEGGSNLSSGEKQVLALTRLMIENPKFVILDEATSMVDAKMEEKIYKAIKELVKNRTCLIVAHRLETIEFCDKILVMSDGKIVEWGSHQELRNLQGHFFNLEKNALYSHVTNEYPAVIN